MAMPLDDEPADVKAFEIPTGSDALGQSQPMIAPLALSPAPDPRTAFAALGQAELKSLSALPEPSARGGARERRCARKHRRHRRGRCGRRRPVPDLRGRGAGAAAATRLAHARLAAPAVGRWRRTGCMRTLHTLKGGARLAGAMRLGELAHRLETAIERLLARGSDVTPADIESLEGRVDALMAVFESLRQRDAAAYRQASEQADAATPIADAAQNVALPAAQPVSIDEPVAATQPRAAGRNAPSAPRRGTCGQYGGAVRNVRHRRRHRLVAFHGDPGSVRRAERHAAVRSTQCRPSRRWRDRHRARACAAARASRQSRRRGFDHAFAHRERCRAIAAAR